MSEWREMIVGDRMAVDSEFTERVRASQFSNQEWGLIMTATELDIKHADDPEAARIVADTDAVESIMPELESIRSGAGLPDGRVRESGSDGVVASIKGALGLGDDTDDDLDRERLAAAESLAQEYADELQAHLESEEAFEAVREAYVDA